MGMIQEFKEFALKGNLVDMAVGIVMGGAVGSLVGSLINNLIDPLVGLATGGVSLGEMATQIGTRELEDGTTEPLLLNYGEFINSMIQFIILAFVVFMIIKVVNTAKKQMNLVEEAAPSGPSEVDLLTEIRDSLKK